VPLVSTQFEKEACREAENQNLDGVSERNCLSCRGSVHEFSVCHIELYSGLARGLMAAADEPIALKNEW